MTPSFHHTIGIGAVLCLSFGIAGLIGATYGPPLLAWLGAPRRPRASGLEPTIPQIEVLIPAHNEASSIAETLRSVAAAVRRSELGCVRVVVGLDHCTDDTERVVALIAAELPLPISVQHKQGAAGKWRMVVQMTRASQAGWLALVDCGSVWAPSLLLDAAQLLTAPDVDAVAPSYMPESAGWLERLNWRLEQSLKQLEARSGGPISIHGATVFYRRTAVLRALDRLEPREWLNDDLVIPTMLRLIDPWRRLAYLQAPAGTPAYVMDHGVKSSVAIEYRRRRRIREGSLEWLHLVFSWRQNVHPAVALLITRRACRLVWGYWATALVLGAVLSAMAWHPWSKGIVASAIGLAALALVFSNYARRLLVAYLHALKAPWGIAAAGRNWNSAEPVSWE